MIRAPYLPLLPGYSIDTNVGQTRFHRPHHFEYIHEGIPYLTEKKKPGVGGKPLLGIDYSKLPSVYARNETIELPPWIVYDKHILAFDGYFVELNEESDVQYSYTVHKVKVYFFLEDGTIKVVEPQLTNSGSPQGCLIKRQRIRYADAGSNDDCYDIVDFNIGKDLQLYGKNITLTDCDIFTRIFLNRLGVTVADPIPIPNDPYMTRRKDLDGKQKKKKITGQQGIQKFLERDNRILSFKAFWDDRQTEYGYLHLLKIIYFLEDATMEIQDVTEPGQPMLIVKRSKLPKQYTGLPQPGETEPISLLNVLGGDREKNRFVIDPLGMGVMNKDYYTDRDLAIGAIVSSYGRRFVIESCDNFTQDYYRIKYGLDDFTPCPRPRTTEEEQMASTTKVELQVAPYNGFGTYEDSLLNCLKVNPTEITKLYTQFYELDREGYDSRILRFSANMLNDTDPGSKRKFIISYYLSDDTIQVNDEVPRNSGYTGGKLISKRKILKHGQNLFGNKPHEYVMYDEFYLGNIVILEDFVFYLYGSDEYALKYMEQHPDKFPKSNVRLIVDKLREAVTPIYKSFAVQFLVEEYFPPATYDKFRDAVKEVLKDKIVEQEIMTLARFYANRIPKVYFPQEVLQRLAHDTLKRELYLDFDHLRESFLHFDDSNKGYVTQNVAYRILRGCKVPLDVEFIKLLLLRMGRGEECLICYDELINFINYKHTMLKPIPPINIPGTLSWMNLSRPEANVKNIAVNIANLLDDLRLEKDLKQQCS